MSYVAYCETCGTLNEYDTPDRAVTTAADHAQATDHQTTTREVSGE